MKIRRAESFSRGQAQQLKNKRPTLHTRTAGSTSYVRVCSRHNMSIYILTHLVNIVKECPLSRHLVSFSESRWDSPPEGYSSIIEQRNEQNARDRPPEEIPLPEPQVRYYSYIT